MVVLDPVDVDAERAQQRVVGFVITDERVEIDLARVAQEEELGMLEPEVEDFVLGGTRERDLAQPADAVGAPAPAPLRLVFVEMAEAMELVDVRRKVAAIVGIAREIEAVDRGGVVVHGRREYPDGPRPSRKGGDR